VHPGDFERLLKQRPAFLEPGLPEQEPSLPRHQAAGIDGGRFLKMPDRLAIHLRTHVELAAYIKELEQRMMCGAGECRISLFDSEAPGRPDIVHLQVNRLDGCLLVCANHRRPALLQKVRKIIGVPRASYILDVPSADVVIGRPLLLQFFGCKLAQQFVQVKAAGRRFVDQGFVQQGGEQHGRVGICQYGRSRFARDAPAEYG
jgi:hypothetical protein